jgi:hypothetical protein
VLTRLAVSYADEAALASHVLTHSLVVAIPVLALPCGLPAFFVNDSVNDRLRLVNDRMQPRPDLAPDGRRMILLTGFAGHLTYWSLCE